MNEFGEPKGSIPFKTGERIPSRRQTFGLESLIALTREGKVALIPRTLTEVQGRLKSEASTMLPDALIESLGLENLTFVELYHPDSKPLVFAGREQREGSVSGFLDQSVAIISLNRSTEMGWGGITGVRLNGRLLPVNISMSGVDQQTKRLVSVSYDAEYDLPEGGNSSGKVIFVLDEVGISVSREDGFEFKEGRGRLDSLPYNYTSQYFEGIFTKGMIEKTDGNATNRINIGRYIRFGQPRLMIPLGLEVPVNSGLIKNPEDLEIDSGRLIRIGRKNIWEINIPETLPTIGKGPKFLQDIK